MRDLRAKIKEWEEWLVGNDINSIRNQIYNMIWDSAVFLSINECRKYAPKNDKGEPELNGVIHQFINRCFFETQAITIRRLLDKRSDVISLRRLVEDMGKYCHLLTRGNILAVHGYPYEYEQEKRRLTEEAFKNKPSGTVVTMDQDYMMCCQAEYVHRTIDSLAGIGPSKRSPDDLVRPQIFEWLKERLSNYLKRVVLADNHL